MASKYIRFDRSEPFNGADHYEIVNRKSKETIGHVFWYPTWHRYVASFESNTVWSEDCLAEVESAIRNLKEPDHA